MKLPSPDWSVASESRPRGGFRAARHRRAVLMNSPRITGSDDPRKVAPLVALGVSIIRKSSLFDDALAVIRKLVFPSPAAP